jgi:acetyl esterase/lipase
MKVWWLLIALLFLYSLGASAQEGGLPYPPKMRDARVEVYKTIGDVKLNLYMFNPPESTPAARRAAIVFFFGGAWRFGSPAQFEAQCRHLASLGIVAITVDYRVSSRHHSTIADSVRDAKSAIRFVRDNALRLGIDPQRIAAGGGSAGGHIAAAAGVIPGLDEPGENQAISSIPNALVLFNPVVLLAPVAGDKELTQVAKQLRELPPLAPKPEDQGPLEGVDLASVSPWHHVSKNDPPMIILHGKADTMVPYLTVEAFAKKMRALGNRCELAGFDGQNHGFFNYRPDGNKYYDETLGKVEEFLASLGYLKIN